MMTEADAFRLLAGVVNNGADTANLNAKEQKAVAVAIVNLDKRLRDLEGQSKQRQSQETGQGSGGGQGGIVLDPPPITLPPDKPNTAG